MKINKTKLTWILGLIAAVITAVLGYLNSSCTAGKSSLLSADSINVHNLYYSTDKNIGIKP